jgi:hypothetical protein
MIKQGGIAVAAIDGINETIDSIINCCNFLVAYWFPKAKMDEEQRHMDKTFVDLRRRDLGYLNRRFVSRQRASLDPGTDVIQEN